ncbi:MAG: DUF1501 domain-containing protein [Gemmataceae bacterium]|nr:DUF1501 domain-containing protein [Gemmataceae bacterium]MCI0742236.1 DUF1501 domain-containing protein [Gemmataceae bacterium]
MLTIRGPQSSISDRISRRRWLQIGGLALGGLALPEILRAEAVSGRSNPAKGIIMVLLPGGPTHLDTLDPKPDAPAEIRGEFRPIATNVPGIDICEHLPRLARLMDKLTIIRSLVGFRDDHNTHWCTTGWESHPAMDSSPMVPGFPAGDWPSLGSVLSRSLGPRVPGVPPCVDLTPKDADARFILRTPPGQPGYLGVAHAGFEAQAVDRRNITLEGVDPRRLDDRRAMLARFDDFRRQADAAGLAEDIDVYQRQAFELLTSSRLAQALDLNRESAQGRRRYGLDSAYPDEREGKTHLDQFLLARRVIEAGARCVTLAFSRWPLGRVLRGDHNWDWHRDLFPEARKTLPLLDLGLSALIQDLHERGLLEDVAVVVWGEFGRTPRINQNAGRDHWANVCSALVAGGGLRTGQVIGSTSRWGEEPRTRPVHFREVFASLYQRLGIDVANTQFTDLSGRPQYLLGEHRPFAELVG